MPNTVPSSINFVPSLDPDSSRLPGSSLLWLKAMRKSGIKRFNDLGLPTTKIEGWKYTNLKPLESLRFQSTSDVDDMAVIDTVPSLLSDTSETPRLVFVNGRIRNSLRIKGDLPKGVFLESLIEVLAKTPDWLEKYLGSLKDDQLALVQLNLAMMDTGFVLRVAPGVVVDQPIEIISVGGVADQPVAYFPRNLVILGKNSQVTLVEHHAGLGVGAYFTNSVTEINLDTGSKLSHYKVQAENREATHLGTAQVLVARGATYDSFTLSIGGRLSRNEVLVQLKGPGAHAGVHGGYLMRGNEHCDNTTVIDHMAPNTTSREIFKGVLDDQSRAVFQGRIVVHKDAQRTDGHQLCKTLLLSSGAEIDAKPELEIYADDVKCSHGATTGQIDETALFYLRSRGIPEALARNLLVQSFLGEALDEISHEEIREALIKKVLHWLPAGCFLSEEWREE
jgi:Fe-S cluster assembly protein SufD